MATKKTGGAAAAAAAIVTGEADEDLAQIVALLGDSAQKSSARAARILEEVVSLKPMLGAPHIKALVAGLQSEHGRVAQACARALPQITRVAPAKVAKQLANLHARFGPAGDIERDAIVRTFVALSAASVAYQKRVIGVLQEALAGADPKTLDAWAEVALPVLKGEPHAQAREVVEARLPSLPRAVAQRIGARLGIKLRPLSAPPKR